MDPLADLLRLIADDPIAAAGRLEGMAAKLTELAAALRAGNSPTLDTPGVGDRVQMNLVGPDGRVRQQVDSQRRPL